MSKVAIYDGLKPILKAITAVRADTTTMEIKYVGLFRNNLKQEHKDNPILFPAILVEFLPSNYMELSGNKIQSYELTVRLHICFESYKDEDTDVLRLVSAVYNAVQYKQFGVSNKLKRRNEEEDFDHDNVQDYIQDYDAGKVMEYPTGATQSATLNEVAVTPEILVQ